MGHINKEAVEKLLSERGYKKQFVARQIGMSPQMFSKMLNSKSNNYIVPYEKLVNLASLLHTKPENIYDRI